MPVHVIVQPKLAKMYPLRRWAIKYPATELVFGDINCRHYPDQNIVQRYRNRGSDLVAAANPRYNDREQRLQRIQRTEPKENSDRRAESDRVRRIGDRHQRHVMRDQPALHSRERLRQMRFINGLARLLWLLWFQRHPIWQKTPNAQRRTANIELQNRMRPCEQQCCTWFGVELFAS